MECKLEAAGAGWSKDRWLERNGSPREMQSTGDLSMNRQSQAEEVPELMHSGPRKSGGIAGDVWCNSARRMEGRQEGITK